MFTRKEAQEQLESMKPLQTIVYEDEWETPLYTKTQVELLLDLIFQSSCVGKTNIPDLGSNKK